jgi:hypothetical protein
MKDLAKPRSYRISPQYDEATRNVTRLNTFGMHGWRNRHYDEKNRFAKLYQIQGCYVSVVETKDYRGNKTRHRCLGQW